MSIEQVKEFTEGLKTLSDDYKEDSQDIADTYKKELQESSDKFAEVYPQVKEAADQFQTASHDFATGMIERSQQYTNDVAALYQSVYGTDQPPQSPPAKA